MLKFVTFIAAAIVLCWLLVRYWPSFRRRLKLALKVGAVAYAVGVIVRLIAFGINADRLVELSLVTLAFLAFWLLIWAVTTFLTRRRKLI